MDHNVQMVTVSFQCGFNNNSIVVGQVMVKIFKSNN